jgi:hypothetical protein
MDRGVVIGVEEENHRRQSHERAVAGGAGIGRARERLSGLLEPRERASHVPPPPAHPTPPPPHHTPAHPPPHPPRSPPPPPPPPALLPPGPPPPPCIACERCALARGVGSEMRWRQVTLDLVARSIGRGSTRLAPDSAIGRVSVIGRPVLKFHPFPYLPSLPYPLSIPPYNYPLLFFLSTPPLPLLSTLSYPSSSRSPR